MSKISRNMCGEIDLAYLSFLPIVYFRNIFFLTQNIRSRIEYFCEKCLECGSSLHICRVAPAKKFPSVGLSSSVPLTDLSVCPSVCLSPVFP
jgi:hypothetical protein